MTKRAKNISLLIQSFVFIILLGTGMILMSYSLEPNELLVFEIAQTKWLAIHHLCAVLSVLLIAMHLWERRMWIKNVMFSKAKKSLKQRKIKRNAVALILFYFLSLSTGMTSWLWLENCEICLGIHDKSGLIVIAIIGFHLIRNTYLRSKYFQFKK